MFKRYFPEQMYVLKTNVVVLRHFSFCRQVNDFCHGGFHLLHQRLHGNCNHARIPTTGLSTADVINFQVDCVFTGTFFFFYANVRLFTLYQYLWDRDRSRRRPALCSALSAGLPCMRTCLSWKSTLYDGAPTVYSCFSGDFPAWSMLTVLYSTAVGISQLNQWAGFLCKLRTIPWFLVAVYLIACQKPPWRNTITGKSVMVQHPA